MASEFFKTCKTLQVNNLTINKKMWFKDLNGKILSQIIGWKRFCISRDQNDLQLENLKVIKNKNKNLLVILAETRLMLEEIHVFLKDGSILIESIIDSVTQKAYTSNSVKKEKRKLLYSGNINVLMSEIFVDKKYFLDLKSYGIAGKGVIKIVLNRKPYDFELN